jgi:hypothetical protein
VSTANAGNKEGQHNEQCPLQSPPTASPESSVTGSVFNGNTLSNSKGVNGDINSVTGSVFDGTTLSNILSNSKGVNGDINSYKLKTRN